MRPSDSSHRKPQVRWGPELLPTAPWAYERVPGAAAPSRAGLTATLCSEPGLELGHNP